MKIVLGIILLYINSCYSEVVHLRHPEDRRFVRKLLNLTEDIIKDTNKRIGWLQNEQNDASSAAYEVGYLTYTIHEKYRRMVDKYNVSKYMTKRLYISELILYLEEIEHHYWEITHISNMLHEVERKYHVSLELDVEYEEPTSETNTPTVLLEDDESLKIPTRPRKKRTRFNAEKYLNVYQLSSTMGSRTKKNKWWPLDYGWEPENQWW